MLLINVTHSLACLHDLLWASRHNPKQEVDRLEKYVSFIDTMLVNDGYFSLLIDPYSSLAILFIGTPLYPRRGVNKNQDHDTLWCRTCMEIKDLSQLKYISNITFIMKKATYIIIDQWLYSRVILVDRKVASQLVAI